MDSYSGENFNIKTRKPYTITKQRERWTEDEHNSFLEALKLYGRAWQRIEEHIGTKTAVQIRSHAQKFFTKLEKEAAVKGVPVKQALDMEIPPPRPKRKPNYPYPRKTGLKTHSHMEEEHGKQGTLLSSLQSLDLERKTLTEKTSHEDELKNTNTNEEGANGSEGPQEAPCASLSSQNENSVPKLNPGVFRKFIPVSTEEANHDESYITIETTKHQELDQDGNKHTNITSNISLFESSHLAHDNIIQGVQNYPRHVPVQVVDGNQGVHAKNSVSPEISFHESPVINSEGVQEHSDPNLFVDIAAAAASATDGHHNNASGSSTVPLFTSFRDNQENYRSFLHVSSTISSLMVSSLLQNPAAHAAATFAAKFWHPANAKTSSGDQVNPETPPPSMEAIVAATVAAATAWWSAHGLLPFCTPFYPGNYSCTFGTPVNVNQPRVYNNETDNAASECVLHEEKMDVEKTEAFLHPEPAADPSLSEDSEEKSNTEATPVDKKEMATVVELHDISKTNIRKQVDRSSCGSNTTSSSETEMDALEKHVKETEETRGSDVNESFSRRGRTSTMSPNDSWKEVSEEGRLAFQALFSREVLPQSFSDSRTVAEKNQQNIVKNSELDLNKVSQEPGESNGLTLLRTGLGSVKLNVHHTGFKPYKRCSIEAKESSNKIVSATGAASAGSQNDEKCPKRIRLETEVST